MRAAPVALASWLLPSLAVLITYLVSAAQGQVPTCIPFFEGCTSISGAARRDPSIHIFRTLMLPTATIMAAYWLLARAWLGHLGDTRRARDWMLALGLIGALFMVLYVVFLGTDGRAYGLMRRYGVMVYFAFTSIAQLVLLIRLHRLPAARRASVGRGVIGVKIGFCVVMLALGIVNIPASYYFEVWEVQNVIAWHFALLMHGFFGLTAISWWRGDYRVVTVIERA
jgi:hypothetical protein